jgi:hypothetical protein
VGAVHGGESLPIVHVPFTIHAGVCLPPPPPPRLQDWSSVRASAWGLVRLMMYDYALPDMARHTPVATQWAWSAYMTL